MNNYQILQKAIDKAKLNGFKLLKTKHVQVTVSNNIDGEAILTIGFESIIFDHEFAKAFWGDGRVNNKHYNVKSWQIGSEEYDDRLMPEWQHRLQQMVLEENPIKYLEKFI